MESKQIIKARKLKVGDRLLHSYLGNEYLSAKIASVEFGERAKLGVYGGLRKEKVKFVVVEFADGKSREFLASEEVSVWFELEKEGK